jgi:hypothetical protein
MLRSYTWLFDLHRKPYEGLDFRDAPEVTRSNGQNEPVLPGELLTGIESRIEAEENLDKSIIRCRLAGIIS